MQSMLKNIKLSFTTYNAVVWTMHRITLALVKSFNGGYVVLQCLKFFLSEHKRVINATSQTCFVFLSTILLMIVLTFQVILDQLARNCVDIATDKIGCSIIQKCLSLVEGSAKSLLVTEIISNAMILAEDPYGFNSTLLN